MVRQQLMVRQPRKAWRQQQPPGVRYTHPVLRHALVIPGLGAEVVHVDEAVLREAQAETGAQALAAGHARRARLCEGAMPLATDGAVALAADGAVSLRGLADRSLHVPGVQDSEKEGGCYSRWDS